MTELKSHIHPKVGQIEDGFFGGVMSHGLHAVRLRIAEGQPQWKAKKSSVLMPCWFHWMPHMQSLATFDIIIINNSKCMKYGANLIDRMCPASLDIRQMWEWVKTSQICHNLEARMRRQWHMWSKPNLIVSARVLANSSIHWFHLLRLSTKCLGAISLGVCRACLLFRVRVNMYELRDHGTGPKTPVDWTAQPITWTKVEPRTGPNRFT